jgi:hypothetical protein
VPHAEVYIAFTAALSFGIQKASNPANILDDAISSSS